MRFLTRLQAVMMRVSITSVFLVFVIIVMFCIRGVMCVMCLSKALLAVENQKIHPERIKRCNENTGHDRKISKAGTRNVRQGNRLDDRVLGIESRKEGGSD